VDYLSQMAIFVKVIDENGFSRAAKALGLTKSTVSKQVAALEERLGVHLVERSSRKLATTDTVPRRVATQRAWAMAAMTQGLFVWRRSAEPPRLGRHAAENAARSPDRGARPRADDKRHPLPAILALSIAAVFSGATTLLAIAEWGRNHTSFAPALGFRHRLTPCVATLSNVFRSLNARALEHVLARYFGALPPAQGAGPGGFWPFSVDGKALRGTFSDDEAASVALVAAFLHRERRVVDQERIEGGDELGAVRRLLMTLPVKGRVRTGDSLPTQRDVCRTLVQKGGPTRCPSRATSPA
jgi:Bacterial regulatory helix-turn-helix protein, lysR family/DDE_Tnp_1-associated